MLSGSIPSVEEIWQTCLNCHIILQAMEAITCITDAFKAWTAGLLPTITILANQGLNNKPLNVNIKDYHNVLRLYFIPNITDIISKYLEEPQTPIPLTIPLLYHIATTVHGRHFWHVSRHLNIEVLPKQSKSRKESG
jgi:hypothetical protein